jgi:hypothetical protein
MVLQAIVRDLLQTANQRITINNVRDLTDPFLAMGLQLVVDGTDPDIVTSILSTQMCFGGHKGKRLLEMCIIMDGVLSIQSGDNPRIAKAKMAAFLGDMGLEADNDETYSEQFKEFFDSLPGTINPRSTGVLDELISGLNDRAVQKILREIDSNELSTAMIGTSGDVAHKLYRNMSIRAATLVREDFDLKQGTITEKEIAECQGKITDIAAKLRERGEIA